MAHSFLRSDPVRLALACALLALLFSWQGTVGGKVFAPLGLLFHFEPWRAIAPERVPAWDVLVWDGTAQFYVWRDLVRALWLSGELPLWNPYALCGTPLLANSQSAPFYPLHLIALPLPTWLAMGWLAWFHLFWAGLGLALWGRRQGWSLSACVASAGVWMFSTFFVAWLQMSSVPATLSWFGWLLLGLRHLQDTGWRGIWAFSLPLGMMLLAGHLQFAFYGVLVALLYALWLIGTSQGRRIVFALRVGVALILGIGLASVQVLPVLEYSGFSHRAAEATEAGYEAYRRNALPLFHTVVAWLPDAYGHPREGSYWGAVHYAELALSVGGLGLLWALVGIARRGEGWFWAGVALVALLIAMGTPLTRLLYFYLPGFSATGSPARVLCLWAFALAVLAGWGIGFVEGIRQGGRVSLIGWGLGGWIVGLAVSLGLAYGLLPAGIDRAPLTQGIVAGLPRTMGLVLLAVGLLVAIRRGLLSVQLGTALLALITVLEPFAQGYRYPLYAERSQAFPILPRVEQVSLAEGERIAVLNTRWSLYEAPSAVMPPNTATMYRLHEVGGYDSLLPRWAKQLLDIVNGTDSAPPENGNMQFVKALTPRLRWLRVEQVLTSEGWMPVPEGAGGLYLGKVEVVDPSPIDWASALEQAWRTQTVLLMGDSARQAVEQYGAGVLVPNAQIEWQEYRATRLRLRVVNPSGQTAWLLLSDTYYPGWRAWLDGKPVPLLQANLAFRAVPIPPGTHEVRMAFLPISFVIGACISGGAGLLLIGVWWRNIRSRV